MKILILLTFVSVASCSFADDTNAIYQTNFQQLIGKSLYSQDMRNFFSHFSHEPTFDNSLNTFTFKDEGMSLQFVELGGVLQLKQVYLFNQCPNFDEYTGPLPFGLKFGMTKGEVEQKFGVPGEDNDFSDTYYTKYLTIYYKTNSIDHIELF